MIIYIHHYHHFYFIQLIIYNYPLIFYCSSILMDQCNSNRLFSCLGSSITYSHDLRCCLCLLINLSLSSLMTLFGSIFDVSCSSLLFQIEGVNSCCLVFFIPLFIMCSLGSLGLNHPDLHEFLIRSFLY